MGTSLDSHSNSKWWNAPEFIRSLPLFVGAAIFFTAGAVLRIGFRAYADYGPGGFTLWVLLIAFGFTATIGGVVSWTLASDATPAAVETPTRLTSPAYLPIKFTEPIQSVHPPEPPRPVRARSDFGRPAPDIRPTAAAGSWYESPTDSERFVGPEYIHPVEVRPPTKSIAEAPFGSEPVEKVLADLERIERELAPRSRVVEPSET